MGLRPPTLRARSTSSKKPVESPPAATAVARPVRPAPERSGPKRTADHFLHTDPPASKPAASTPTTPVGEAVSQAYQVFDRYLQEGQQYAAGESAWYNPSAAGAAGGSGQNLVGAALWLFEQMRAMAPLGATLPIPPSIPLAPAIPTSPRTNAATPAPAKPASAAAWEDAFDEDDDNDVQATNARNTPLNNGFPPRLTEFGPTNLGAELMTKRFPGSPFGPFRKD